MNWLLGVRQKSRMTLVLACSTGGMAVFFTEMGENLERKGVNQELYFRHVKFEMPVRHLGGDVAQAVRQMSEEETGVGGVSLGGTLSE